VLFAQLWGVDGVHILTFTVIPTPFMRTSRRVGAGLGAHFERSLKREILAEIHRLLRTRCSAAVQPPKEQSVVPSARARPGAEPKT
jgi:hypothetical protein